MKIIIETIPHEKQRYETPGDYYIDEDQNLRIKISELGNTFYERLVAIHELIEWTLTDFKGIKEEDIMNFDIYFEGRRKLGLVQDNAEPGFNKNAPYTNEHAIATSVELIMCSSAGVAWEDYENSFESLKNKHNG